MNHPKRSPGEGTAGIRRSGVALAAVAIVIGLITPGAVASNAGAIGPVLADSFSRPDNWQLGSTETGQPWQVWSGTATVSGQMVAASVPGYTLAVADSGISTGVVAVSVPVVSDEFWMILRATNTGNYWRFGRWQGGAYQLQQIAGWALGTPAVTTLASINAAAGDRLECRLSSGVTCSVNGADVATTADPFNGSASFVGFAAYDPSAAPAVRFDDVHAAAASAAPDVAVAVVADDASVEVGGAVSWTATVMNAGSLAASGVRLTAGLPGAVTGVGAVASSGSCVVAAEIVCEMGALDPGQAVTVQVSGIAPPRPQLVTLSVAVGSASVDADPMNNEGSAAVTVEAAIPPNAVVVDNFARPDSWSMGVAPTGQTWQVWQGTARVAGERALASEPGYAMSVIDAGTTTGSVMVSVPAVSSDYWVIARASNTGNYWRFGRSAGGPYELQQIRNWALGSPLVDVLAAVTPAPGDQIMCRFLTGITCSVNGVDVASSADPFNGSASFVGFAAYGASAAPDVRFDDFRATTPSPAADLVVDVVAEKASVEAGQSMSWTATITNTGNQSASDVTTATPSPAGLGSLVATGPSGVCPVSNGVHQCGIGSLAPGAAAIVRFSAVAPAAIGSYTVQLTAGPIATDGDRSNNRDAAAVSVRVLARPGENVSDHFDRPNSVTLGNEEGGRPWEMLQGTFGVVGGQAAKTDTTSLLSMAVIDPGFTFGTVQVRVTAGADDEFYLMFRAKDNGNTYLLGPDAARNYRVHKMIGGRMVGLQFNAIRANVRARDGDVIRLVVRPDDGWFVAINGVHVLDGGDVELLGQFRFGLATRSSNVRFDDLSITQLISTGITTVESFQHPEESNLEGRMPTSGTVYQWFGPQGYWVTRGGRGVLDSPGFGLAFLQTGSQLSNIRANIVSSRTDAWVVFRREEDGSYYRFGYESTGGRRYTIERVRADGETTTVPGGVITHRLVRSLANDLVEVRQLANGTIRGYVNGLLVASAVDSVNGVQASAYGMAGTVGATFDNIVITPP
ncbi:MAG TPA: DUF11 domain-containing protein [Ilumatobacter sp.]|jgi:hypothetical protein|nr:DUF11 domain-containing protein [Ilumatobacter sp.]